MRRRSSIVICAIACHFGAACGRSTEILPGLGPVPDGSFTTNATEYVATPIRGTSRPVEYEFSVITRFENRSAAPVFLARCYPNSPQPMYGIGSADGSPVEAAYNPSWACVGHDKQFQVLPGAVRVDTFVVRGPNAFDETKQQAIGVTNGAFRLMLSVASAPGDGAPAAAGSLGISNAFAVHTSQ